MVLRILLGVVGWVSAIGVHLTNNKKLGWIFAIGFFVGLYGLLLMNLFGWG